MLLASVPIRFANETDTDQLAKEQDRAAQGEQVEGIVGDRARAEITRPFRSFEVDKDMDVKRQRLGEPLATIPEEVAGAETSDMMSDDLVPLLHEEARRGRLPEELSSGSSIPKRIKTAYLRVSSVSALQKPSTRTEESIVKSREVHMKHLLDIGAVKDRNRENAIKTRPKILSIRLVDDAHTEKSKWCATEVATNKDPSVFAATSDVDNTSLIDLLAVQTGSRHHVLRRGGRIRPSS